MSETRTMIFTDGACKGNPGPGGWAAIVARDGVYAEFGGREAPTTNNRMEMTGAIEGLKRLKPDEAAVVVTDSSYLVDGATKWIFGWMKRGWKKSDGDEVLNRDLWEAIVALSKGRKITWEHVRGHAGHPENERCDAIASGFAGGTPPELKTGDGAWIFGRNGAQKADEKYPKPLYLSLVGGAIEEHATWEECSARITGIKGSKCKKVATRAEHLKAIVAWTDEA